MTRPLGIATRPRRFSGSDLLQIGMPLGGIGAGPRIKGAHFQVNEHVAPHADRKFWWCYAKSHASGSSVTCGTFAASCASIDIFNLRCDAKTVTANTTKLFCNIKSVTTLPFLFQSPNRYLKRAFGAVSPLR